MKMFLEYPIILFISILIFSVNSNFIIFMECILMILPSINIYQVYSIHIYIYNCYYKYYYDVHSYYYDHFYANISNKTFYLFFLIDNYKIY
jgi:hypothetical protein